MMKLLGPVTTPPAVGGTSTITTESLASGYLAGVVLEVSPGFSSSGTLQITSEGASNRPPGVPLFVLPATRVLSGAYYPRISATNAATGQSANTLVLQPVYDRLVVSIDSVADGDYVSVWFFLEED